MRDFFWLLFIQIFEVFLFLKPLNKKNIIFFSNNNNHFNFNSKYLFLFFLKKNTSNCYFVINDDIYRNQLIQLYGEHFITTKKIKDIYIISNAKTWITSVIENPYIKYPIPMLLNPKRIHYHIGHGVPLKKILLALPNTTFLQYISRISRIKALTHILSYSKKYEYIMREQFGTSNLEYIALGQPRNDALILCQKADQLEKIRSIYPDLPEHKQSVLYAPTWRSYDTVRFFPFEDLTAEELNEHLKENKTVLFLRKHPYFPSILDESYLEQSNIYLFDTDFFPEIMDYLSYFDKLITDYSSIYLDFLCLDRPIAFIPYDLEKYEEHTGFTIPYEELTPGQYLITKDNLFSYIAIATDDYSEQRKEIATLVNAKSSGNCEENYQFIQQLLKE